MRCSVVLLLVVAIAIIAAAAPRRTEASLPTCNAPWNRPDGMLIRDSRDGGIYLVQACQKRHITDMTALNSHRFDQPFMDGAHPWGDASAQEVDHLAAGAGLRSREGTLFIAPDGAVYIIDEIGAGSYQKRHITAAGWAAYFAPCGYGFNAPFVISESQGYLDGYPSGGDVSNTTVRPDGQLISAGGYTYMLEGSQRRWITDPASLNTYNFPQPICFVSAAEANSYALSAYNLRAREGTLSHDDRAEVWITDNTGPGAYTKRHVAGADGFNYFGLSWVALRLWSRADVDSYAFGADTHPYKTIFPFRWYQANCSPVCDYVA